jgi:hypothetical protein
MTGSAQKVVRLRTDNTRKDEQRLYHLAKQRWHYQMVRLDHDDIRMLRVVAQREHTTVAELIRTFIVWGLEQYDGELDYDRDCDGGRREWPRPARNDRAPFHPQIFGCAEVFLEERNDEKGPHNPAFTRG